MLVDDEFVDKAGAFARERYHDDFHARAQSRAAHSPSTKRPAHERHVTAATDRRPRSRRAGDEPRPTHHAVVARTDEPVPSGGGAQVHRALGRAASGRSRARHARIVLVPRRRLRDRHGRRAVRRPTRRAGSKRFGPLVDLAVYKPRQAERSGSRLLLFGTDGPVAFIKICDDEASRTREAAILTAIDQPDRRRAISTPRLLDQGFDADLHWFATHATSRRHAPPRDDVALRRDRSARRAAGRPVRLQAAARRRHPPPRDGRRCTATSRRGTCAGSAARCGCSTGRARGSLRPAPTRSGSAPRPKSCAAGRGFRRRGDGRVLDTAS